MAKANLPSLPKQSMVYILLCLSGIVCIIGLLIYPAYVSLTELDLTIAQKKLAIEEQNVLFPLFNSLLQNKNNTAEPTGLPAPVLKKLNSDESESITEFLKQMAIDSSLNLTKITTDSKPGHLLLNLTTTGKFENFRELLVILGGNPGQVKIETIEITSLPGTKQMDLLVWMAMED